MKILITGGAGFIGSHLIGRLAGSGNEIIAVDNLSVGKLDYIADYIKNGSIKFIRCDILDIHKIKQELTGTDMVFHLAAVLDVRRSIEERMNAFENNVTATMSLLEAMKECDIKQIAYFSTQAVYGEERIKSEETAPHPVSLYGATKLASEHLIEAYSRCFGIKSWIFRLANVVGARQTHGILVDLARKLRNGPNKLEILGDGKQEKTYIHISDCLDAVFHIISHSKELVNLFNAGSSDTITVADIAKILLQETGANPELVYTGGRTGWPGDIAFSSLPIEKLKSLGWHPKYSSRQAIQLAVKELINN